MARSPLRIIALTAGVLMVLSTLLYVSWQRSITVRTFSHFCQLTPLQDALGPAKGDTYLLGVGKADITGPVVEINLMGYADTKQVGSGLRQRLHSRAFIIGHISKHDDRFVYLVLDTQSGDTAVRHGILKALGDLGDEYAVYGSHNVAVTGTHSHSGPGAWLNYLLPQITSYGFHKPSYQAIVDGAVASIVSAHQTLAPGQLSIGNVDIFDASINRSPYAYLANPAEERARYTHDVDKALTLLRFTHLKANDKEVDVGVLTWFAVHGTSMHSNNTLITGDNKGVAAYLFERSTGNADFVAGFSQANVGDTTPNIIGAYCESGDDEGKECDFQTSLCGNRSQPCHGRGPYFARDDAGTASTYEIGRRQYAGARQLFSSSSAFTPIRGEIVRSLHHFVDLSTYIFSLPNGTVVRTCPAALGYSFAAGTTDGPGAFDFKQAQPGDPHANPLWSRIGDRLHKANETQRECHGEKAILLDVGESENPYAWSPNIVDIQLQRVGQLVLVVVPGEATTMAGRRWRRAVHDAVVAAADSSEPEPMVVLGGPANTYAHYIATAEEYSIQRYEGASTLYGPHTLNAYIDITTGLLPYLSSSPTEQELQPGPQPPVLTNDSLSFIRPVVVDTHPLFHSFGSLILDVAPSYKAGDTISATFVGANPRNNLRLGGTFTAVERLDHATQTWSPVRDDADWSLVYEWRRTSSVLGTSEVTIRWETEWETGAWRGSGVEAADDEKSHGDLLVRDKENEKLQGLYRLKYYGDAKGIGGGITAFEGVSGEFRIL